MTSDGSISHDIVLFAHAAAVVRMSLSTRNIAAECEPPISAEEPWTATFAGRDAACHFSVKIPETFDVRESWVKE